MAQTAVVVGAGLVGCLQALFLKQKGFQVKLYESRSDYRKLKSGEGRSINLVLTHRGIQALKKLNLDQEILSITVPVSGREVHLVEGKYFQPYGVNGEENYSIGRLELNQKLLQLCDDEQIELYFERAVKSVDFEQKQVHFEDAQVHYDILFGCDGVNSPVRESLINQVKGESSLTDLGVGYQEFILPADENGDYAINKNALHIWPHGKHFLMALPNLHGSFTMTLYLHREGSISFEQLSSEDEYKKYFAQFYPGISDLCPDYAQQLVANPAGRLGTLRCQPWHYQNEVCLIGDAAHAITPFFGQGMNLGFEDCALLNSLFYNQEQNQYDFESFFNYQKESADAIATMAEENYWEMSEKVGDETFILMKKIDQELEKRFPDKYKTRYSQVMYTCDPYAKCFQQGKQNQKIIEQIVAQYSEFEQINWDEVGSILK